MRPGVNEAWTESGRSRRWTSGRSKKLLIEKAVGETLDWERLDGKRASRIALYFPTEIRVTEEQRWPEARAWLVQAMGKMRDAIRPILEELRP